MLILDDPGSDASYMLTQTTHAWLAWQVAEHWGNRRFARPAPRAEVLAAVFLHDAGWTEFDMAPVIDRTGRPRTFDRMEVHTHLQIWRSCVHRAAMHSRYSGMLVAQHFASMAETKTSDLLEDGDTVSARAVQVFRAEMERLDAGWSESLGADARYRPYLSGAGWEAATQVLTACDSISVHLCAGIGSSFEVTASTPEGGTQPVVFEQTEPYTWRVQPWPLEGDRLRVQCEARKLHATTFEDEEALREAAARAPEVRLSFTLHRPSAG